jgi:putative alpha-1,2-mannosidase
VDERLRPVRHHAGDGQAALHAGRPRQLVLAQSRNGQPYYYSVYLADADVTTEIAPTERAAQFRFTWPKTDEAYVVVDAYDKGSYIKVLPEQRKIVGYSTRYARGPLPKNFKNYFVIYFDKPFTSPTSGAATSWWRRDRTGQQP